MADEDYPLERVPRAKRHAWFGVAVQRFGQLSDLTQFLVGASLGAGLTFWGAFWAFTLGSVTLEVVSIFIGIAGMREGVSTSVLARWTGFGRYGGALLGLLMAVSLFGWFGVQTGVFAEGLHSMLGGVPLWAWCLIAGVGTTLLVLRGFRAMGWTAFVTVPAFLGLVGWAVGTRLADQPVHAGFAGHPFGAPLTIASGATIVAGSYMIGALTTPDMTRFNRTAGDVVKQTVVGITLGEYVLGLAGVWLAQAMRSSDLIALITASSGAVGVLILICATVKINNWNLYSCVLGLINAVQTLFGIRLHRVTCTIVLGVLGSLAAALGILGAFTGFLNALGIVTTPVAGIMVAEYFIVRRWRGELDVSRARGRLPDTEVGWVPGTMLVWALAIAVGWLSDSLGWWGIPALNALLIGLLGYVVLGRLGWLGARGSFTFEQPENPAATVEIGEQHGANRD
ncbi:purine-cytosine permease family protein [Sciscionella sediminilitoris]|uniref:purine-cytosine permease family protein n=1 Tax=Sciscionella sediminilitoris TaxID=1445613 RepID=UPI00055E7278|nr:cytosine permease [Sciscionella sp. SE31]